MTNEKELTRKEISRIFSLALRFGITGKDKLNDVLSSIQNLEWSEKTRDEIDRLVFETIRLGCSIGDSERRKKYNKRMEQLREKEKDLL